MHMYMYVLLGVAIHKQNWDGIDGHMGFSIQYGSGLAVAGSCGTTCSACVMAHELRMQVGMPNMNELFPTTNSASGDALECQ